MELSFVYMIHVSVKQEPKCEPTCGSSLYICTSIRPCPNDDFGMHSRDAYPQFADVWVLPGYHIKLLHISEYVFSITLGYLASLG